MQKNEKSSVFAYMCVLRRVEVARVRPGPSGCLEAPAVWRGRDWPASGGLFSV